MKKCYVSRGNEAIVNSRVLVLEDNPMAGFLFNWYRRRLGLGEYLLRRKKINCNDEGAQKNHLENILGIIISSFLALKIRSIFIKGGQFWKGREGKSSKGKI